MRLSVSRRRIAVAVGVLAIALLAFVAFEMTRAVLALRQLGNDSAALGHQVSAAKISEARQSLSKLQSDSRSAHEATRSVVWRTASHLPLIGDNFGAAAVGARVADTVVHECAPTLVDLASDFESGPLKPVGGRIDPAGVAARSASLATAAQTVDASAKDLLAYRPGSLLPFVSRDLAKAQRSISQLQRAVDGMATAARVLPGVLRGPHDYLVLVQNPAEIRASGGLPGTWLVMHVDDGRVSIANVYGASELGKTAGVVTPTADEKNLFGEWFGYDIGDMTVTPDFPRIAQIAVAKLKATKGVSVDGVFSVDPIVLGDVLRGTGPVKVPETGPAQVLKGAPLTSANAASILMNQIYMVTSDYNAQQAFFASAAANSFAALTRGQGNITQSLRGLITAAGQHRVLAWAPDPDLTSAFAKAGITGAFEGDSGATPNVGVFMNDAVAGKPEFYLQHHSSLKATSCKDGRQTLELTTTLTSKMPANAATFPYFVVGSGAYAPPGVIALSLDLASPWQGTMTDLAIDGHGASVGQSVFNGRLIAVVPIILHPGQSKTVTATMQTGPGQTGSPRLTWTPGMSESADPVVVPSAC